MTKICPVCGRTFEPDHPSRKYCSPDCVKQVAREKDRRYREANQEKLKAYKREYYLKHRQECIAYQTEYRKNNAEKVKACKREYRKNNADRIRAYKREYMRRRKDEMKDKREMEKETHGCGFTGLCSDCPFEMCTE